MSGHDQHYQRILCVHRLTQWSAHHLADAVLIVLVLIDYGGFWMEALVD